MTQVAQRFGGGWTRQKLDVVENYLVAYTRGDAEANEFQDLVLRRLRGIGVN